MSAVGVSTSSRLSSVNTGIDKMQTSVSKRPPSQRLDKFGVISEPGDMIEVAPFRELRKEIEWIMAETADCRHVKMVGMFMRHIDEGAFCRPIEVLLAGVVLQPPAAPISRSDKPRVGQQYWIFPVLEEGE